MKFPTRVKHVVKKMHGLNVCQAINTRRIQQNVFSGDSQQSINSTYSIDSPGTLGYIIPDWNTAASDTQWYIKRLYRTVRWVNTGQFPVIWETYKIYVRKDIILVGTAAADDPWEIAEDDGVSATIPYVSPFTGNTFQKQFKILSSRRKMIQPGASIKFKTYSRYNGATRPINRAVEGDVRFSYRKGNRLTMCRVYGTPISYVPTSGPVTEPDTILSPIQMNGVDTEYVSWYRLDDVLPTSYVVNNLYTTVPGVHNGISATRTFPARPGDTSTTTGGNLVPPLVYDVAVTPP